jgi:alcohol oxidase
VWVYKKQREVARRMKSYRGELASHHPKFPPESKASLNSEPEHDENDLAASRCDQPAIEYSPEDDKVIEEWVRERLGVCWHFLGTCKMAPSESLGVVDGRLNVHGLQGLKIADMSIAPRMVSANTYSTALVIGEKAADMVIEELGLQVK